MNAGGDAGGSGRRDGERAVTDHDERGVRRGRARHGDEGSWRRDGGEDVWRGPRGAASFRPLDPHRGWSPDGDVERSHDIGRAGPTRYDELSSGVGDGFARDVDRRVNLHDVSRSANARGGVDRSGFGGTYGSLGEGGDRFGRGESYRATYAGDPNARYRHLDPRGDEPPRYGYGYAGDMRHDAAAPSYDDELSLWERAKREAKHGWEKVKESFAGKGPKGYKRSDERIREDVCEQLSLHPGIDASEIEVSVRDGEVILTGSVAQRHMKRLAEDVCEDISGVADVSNQIRVARPAAEMSARDGSKTAMGMNKAPIPHA